MTPLRRNRTIAALLLLTGIGCGRDDQQVQEVIADASKLIPAGPIETTARDWPWWRGYAGQNQAVGTPPVRWSDSDGVLWKTPLPGRGHGSPIIFGNAVFLCTADEVGQTQSMLRIDRGSGRQIWLTELQSGGFPSPRKMHPKSSHANVTPACDGQLLFAAFLSRKKITAFAIDLEGSIVWKSVLGAFGSKFGYAPSPCLHEALAFFAADNRSGGFIAAVHRETGNIVWRKRRNNVDTYSSPIVARVAGRDQMLISGGNIVASYDPLTGEELWTCPGTAESTCGTIIWQDDLVYASGGYPEHHTLCIHAESGEKVWETNVNVYESSMLLANDHLFAVTNSGIAICCNAATGERWWRHRLSGQFSASPVLVNDLIYATSETGTTTVFRADPGSWEELAVNQLGDECFASMAVCDNRIYARVAHRSGSTREEFLYCLGYLSDPGK